MKHFKISCHITFKAIQYPDVRDVVVTFWLRFSASGLQCCHFTRFAFRTENRLDCDTASIFSRMQQGAKLIQGDAELFNGFFQIVVKDVVSDAKEVAQEFKQKIQHIIARDKEDNFFLRLYKGRAATSVLSYIGFVVTREFAEHLEFAALVPFLHCVI